MTAPALQIATLPRTGETAGMEAYCNPRTGRFAPASVERLRNLTRINQGSARRLRYAAAAAGDRMLGRRLDKFATMRQAHAQELLACVPAEVEDASSVQDDFSAPALPVASDRPERVALLTELERGESAACRAFTVALDRTLPGEAMQDLLSRQLAETQRNRDIMRDLRDMMIED